MKSRGGRGVSCSPVSTASPSNLSFNTYSINQMFLPPPQFPIVIVGVSSTLIGFAVISVLSMIIPIHATLTYFVIWTNMPVTTFQLSVRANESMKSWSVIWPFCCWRLGNTTIGTEECIFCFSLPSMWGRLVQNGKLDNILSCFVIGFEQVRSVPTIPTLIIRNRLEKWVAKNVRFLNKMDSNKTDSILDNFFKLMAEFEG